MASDLCNRVFENTFAPTCKHKTLTADQIICGMRFGVFQTDSIPTDIRKAVQEEIDRRRAAGLAPGEAPPEETSG